ERAFDIVLSSAVLHFARGESQFRAMLQGSWRHLKPGGLFFCRLASSIGMADRMTPLGDRRFLLPDGSERFLVDQDYLLALTAELGGALVDPLKTTVVQDQRCMTTWVVNKDEGADWDRRIEADVQTGKLDALAERALQAHAEGRSTKL
ncbi:MAG TPA: class I SAM-dependent methyltransferase, partial [Thermoanaerobaculia bacterium]